MVAILAVGTLVVSQATWTVVDSGTTENLKAIAFTWAYDGTAVAVGSNGTILRTSDGGISWAPVPGPPGYYLWSVAFFDGLVGVISGTAVTGNILLRTEDAGLTWSTVAEGQDAPALYGISPVGSLDAWAFGLQTTDGGFTWNPTCLPGPVAGGDANTALSFRQWSRPWCFGSCIGTVYGATIYRTRDGGQTCEEVWMGATAMIPYGYPPPPPFLSGILYVDWDRAIAYGHGEVETRDAGQTWALGGTFPDFTAGAMSFSYDAVHGIAVGTPAGTVFRAPGDFGQEWTAEPVPTDSALNSVWVVDESLALAVGDNGTILRRAP